MKRWKKPISFLCAGGIITGLLFTSTVDASQAKKNLEAYYQNIKIVYNSQSATIDPKTEPFISNSVTYVPLRMVSELFDKSVTWDGKTSTISIADKTAPVSPTVIASLNAQITAKDVKIAQLEAEIKSLKESQSKVVSLTDLKDTLNKKYRSHNDVSDVEIFLSGNKDDIDMRVDVDSYDWNRLSDTKKKRFVQDIADDTLAEFKNAKITGKIRDYSKGDVLASFKTTSKGVVELEDETVDLKSLELQLVRNHNSNNDIRNIDIYLSGNKNDISVTIQVNKTDWTNLSESKKISFIEDIVDDILAKHRDAEIEGIIEAYSENNRLNRFTVDSRGRVTIR